MVMAGRVLLVAVTVLLRPGAYMLCVGVVAWIGWGCGAGGLD